MTRSLAPMCLYCKHFHGGRSDDWGYTCDAFPKGIPNPVIDRDFDHRNPHPGDNGIRFEAGRPVRRNLFRRWDAKDP